MGKNVVFLFWSYIRSSAQEVWISDNKVKYSSNPKSTGSINNVIFRQSPFLKSSDQFKHSYILHVWGASMITRGMAITHGKASLSWVKSYKWKLAQFMDMYGIAIDTFYNVAQHIEIFLLILPKYSAPFWWEKMLKSDITCSWDKFH